jgi:hypothetical protein
MRADADFFCLPPERVVFDKSNVSLIINLIFFRTLDAIIFLFG